MTSSGSTVLFGAIPIHLKPTAAEKRALERFAGALSAGVCGARPFVCLLADDTHLRSLNRDFLGHDYATDVLSFPSGEPAGQLGEMAISLERAAAQASEFGHGCLDEVRILMLHGALHLAGFDHAKDRGEMARAEKRWRAAFGLPETLIARASKAQRARKRAASEEGNTLVLAAERSAPRPSCARSSEGAA